jgi:hypothetical protein
VSYYLGPNGFAATSLPQVFRTFSRLAIKYKQEYDRVPVLIINNANKLAHKHQRLLDQFQNYAMDAAEKGTATVVFMSREGRIPRGMLGKVDHAYTLSFDCMC